MLLAGVIFLLVYASNYRIDLPLFFSGFLLGYWGEWWGTTRGIWWYWNAATPPDYLPPLWGLGLLTVYHLSKLLLPLMQNDLPRLFRWGMIGSFFLLPMISLAYSWYKLMLVDWAGRLDFHFAAGLVVALILIVYRFDLRRDFLIYFSGTILGFLYEFLGTSIGEWAYITAEEPPIWIAPLWGLAAVAMVSLAEIITRSMEFGWSRIRKIWS